MKNGRVYGLLFCLQFTIAGYAQEPVAPKPGITREDVISPGSEKVIFNMDSVQGLSESNFKKILNREFTSLLSSLATLSVGNYLAVDQTDAQAKLAFSRVFSDGGIFGINFSGAAPGGVIVLADNSRATYDFSVGAQYHFFNLDRGRNVSINKLLALKKERDVLDNKVNKEFEAADFNKIRERLVNEKDSLEKIQKTLKSTLTGYRSPEYTDRTKDSLKVKTQQLEYLINEANSFDIQKALTEINNADCPSEACTAKKAVFEKYMTLYLKRHVLKEELERTKSMVKTEDGVNVLSHKQITKTENALEANKKKFEANRQVLKQHDLAIDEFDITNLEISNAYLKELGELDTKKLEAYDVDEFAWVSIGGQVNRNQFSLFDASLTLEEQLSSESYTGGELTFQLSYYNKSPEIGKGKPLLLRPMYANFGVSMRFINNVEDLTKVTIKDETTLVTSNDVSRTVSDDISAFQGPYEEDLRELFVYGDYYYFLFNGNFTALHWYPNVNIREGRKALWNMDIGLVLSFKNPKDKTALVNTELFFRLKDLTNTTSSGLRLFERNTVGLRLTVPINFRYD